MTEPTDDELAKLFTEETGFDVDDFPAAILDFARAARQRWGTPVGAGEPFGYFHQLLNHEGKGNGVWLGAAERKVVEQAHTPGETSEEIVTLYTTPQPTHAQAVAVTDAQVLAAVRVMSPGLFRHGLQPLPNDGANTAAQMRKEADTARKMLDAAFSAAQPVAREPLPKFLALKFHARRDKKAAVTLLFPGHEAADAWVRGIKGGQP